MTHHLDVSASPAVTGEAIPRVIHQMWIGPDPAPSALIDTWRQAHPSWIHRLWTETELDNPDLLAWRSGCRRVYDIYLTQRCFHGASDVVRAEVLRVYGGVWLDADMECLHALDDAQFLQPGVRFWVSESPNRPGGTQTSAMGASPGHRIIDAYSDGLACATRLRPAWLYAGSGLLERVLAELEQPDNVIRVPSPAFQPRKSNGMANPEAASYTGVVYADHKYASTHAHAARTVHSRRSPQPRHVSPAAGTATRPPWRRGRGISGRGVDAS